MRFLKLKSGSPVKRNIFQKEYFDVMHKIRNSDYLAKLTQRIDVSCEQ